MLLISCNISKEKKKVNYEIKIAESLATSRSKRNLPKKDRPDLAWEQDFLMTMNPHTKKTEREKLHLTLQNLELNQKKQNETFLTTLPGENQSYEWVERGPLKTSGRIRAIMFDPNDSSSKKVWAGGVSGGLWFNNDITSETSEWKQINDIWINLSITAITYDPNNSQIFYVGTGEGWGSRATSTIGNGIWKTIDGGQTWSHLNNSKDFSFIPDLVVRNEGGNSVLYVASNAKTHEGTIFGGSVQGLYRSTDGGNTFNQVLPNVPLKTTPYSPVDIEISSEKIWIGTGNNFNSNIGGGYVLYSLNGTDWTTSYSPTTSLGRTEIAVSKNNSNHIYGVIENNSIADRIIKSVDNGTTWTEVNEPSDTDTDIPNTDFTRGQAWYNLILEVDPNNSDVIYIGGIDLFRSDDAGNTWKQISKWSDNNDLKDLNVSYVHSDQHNIVFRPSSNNEMIIVNDGGVFYGKETNFGETKPVFNARNLNLNITQFYSCAIAPEKGSFEAVAGSQDNGTQYFDEPGIDDTFDIFGGDGGYCFIDQVDKKFLIASYVYNYYSVYSYNLDEWFSISMTEDGNFINQADFDDEKNILFAYAGADKITKYQLSEDNIKVNISKETIELNSLLEENVSTISSITNIKVIPQKDNSEEIFFGTASGNVYRYFKNRFGVGNPKLKLISSGLNQIGSVSSIEIGSTSKEILVTLSNYGINSIWHTSDSGLNWENKQGNLPDMPIRWGLFNPNNLKEVILATELGIWGTKDIYTESPNWIPLNTNLGYVRVNMLQIRASDFEVVAATYGRGLFSSGAFNDRSLAVKNEQFASSQIKVYPTVSAGELKIASKEYLGETAVTIFNISGQKVHSELMEISSAESILNLTHLSSGMYIMKFSNQSNNQSHKFMIE